MNMTRDKERSGEAVRLGRDTHMEMKRDRERLG
jgi:hypothetical protein